MNMNVHLFVLLQNTVPLPIPTFVWCRLLRMFQYADSPVMEREHDSSFVRHSLVSSRDDFLDAH